LSRASANAPASDLVTAVPSSYSMFSTKLALSGEVKVSMAVLVSVDVSCVQPKGTRN
jgi:hypothetical protein